MISVNKISMSYPIEKSYKDLVLSPFSKRKFHKALNQVSIEIQSGDKVAFLGGNGAGKTTLLKLIGGLLYPTEGNIFIDNYDTIVDNQKSRKNVGFVLNEERSFYWRLTGRQNLSFFGALDNFKDNDLDEKIDSLIKKVNLEKAADRIFAGYSSGMKQRLAIARGLLGEPQILILDEPTRTLDPLTTNEIHDLIKSIYSNEGKTLLMATHNLFEAELLCNKICIMKAGEIKYFNSISNTINQYGTLINCYTLIFGDNV